MRSSARLSKCKTLNKKGVQTADWATQSAANFSAPSFVRTLDTLPKACGNGRKRKDVNLS